MNIEEAKTIILKMDIEELIATINGMVDTKLFPLGQIHEIDDEDYWNRISARIGGYEMFRKLTDIPNYLTNGIAYFVYDDDEQGMFEFFKDKESIIDYFGIENISENYILDNN